MPLNPDAQSLAMILAAVVVLWVTEALPLPVTALAGVVACVVAGVAPANEVFRPFADPLIFLFIGSFMLAEAIRVHGLDRRLAFSVLGLPAVGERPGRILAAVALVSATISAFISNTATTAMMVTIAAGILAAIEDAAHSAAHSGAHSGAHSSSDALAHTGAHTGAHSSSDALAHTGTDGDALHGDALHGGPKHGNAEHGARELRQFRHVRHE